MRGISPLHCLRERKADLNTRLLEATEQNIMEGARLLKAGQPVAFPTETVYGLGANALDAQAVECIFAAKQRPADNPLIVHIAAAAQAPALCQWTETAQLLAEAFWPGPLTLVLQKKAIIPDIVTAGLGTVAIRMPDHAMALRLIQSAELPIAAPSANSSGRPSPTTAQHVLNDLQGRIPLILDGGRCRVGLESTVLDLQGQMPTILRPGAVTPEQIAFIIGDCRVADSVMRPLRPGEPVLSPGMRHRHYAPKAKLTLVEGGQEVVARLICQGYDTVPGTRIMAMNYHLPLYGRRMVDDLGPDVNTAAQRLFYLLRAYDEQDVTQIYCETLPPTGLGLAVMNRLARAAKFDIIHAGYDDK
jgi:L-threonylcarbamoyladenylate synthase